MMQTMIDEPVETSEGIETTIIEEEKSTGLAFESEAEDDYEPRFEIRERTKGLAQPKIIPLNKENLAEIVIGLFSLKEIKEIERMKRERKGS